MFLPPDEKKLKLDEFLPIYSQVKKDKDQGTFEDFLEALKLYDKEENGTMMSAELSNMFLALGKLVHTYYICRWDIYIFDLATLTRIVKFYFRLTQLRHQDFISIFFCLGEKLTDAETEELLKDCMEPEDDDGFTPYERKLHFIRIKCWEIFVAHSHRNNHIVLYTFYTTLANTCIVP